MHILPGDLGHPQVIALLGEHLADLRAQTPPDRMHALDASGLADPDVTFLTAWDGDTLVGLGALKALSPTHGEIKSMRTARAHLRKGVAGMVLDHLVALARSRGYERLSLETDVGPRFAPAAALYASRGFTRGGPFSDYPDGPDYLFMHLDLRRA